MPGPLQLIDQDCNVFWSDPERKPAVPRRASAPSGIPLSAILSDCATASILPLSMIALQVNVAMQACKGLMCLRVGCASNAIFFACCIFHSIRVARQSLSCGPTVDGWIFCLMFLSFFVGCCGNLLTLIDVIFHGDIVSKAHMSWFQVMAAMCTPFAAMFLMLIVAAFSGG